MTLRESAGCKIDDFSGMGTDILYSHEATKSGKNCINQHATL